MNYKGFNNVKIIVAVDEDGGYAKDGKIPWHYTDDMVHFQNITKNNICIMGRGTYEDIASRLDEIKDSILPSRDVYVVSSKLAGSVPEGTKGAFLSTRKVFETIRLPLSDKRDIFILGGRRLYLQHILHATTVHLTLIPGRHQCNHFFPVEYLSKRYNIIEGKKKGQLKFITYAQDVIQYELYPPNQQMFADLFKKFKRDYRFVSRNNVRHSITVNSLTRKETRDLQNSGVRIDRLRVKRGK